MFDKEKRLISGLELKFNKTKTIDKNITKSYGFILKAFYFSIYQNSDYLLPQLDF